jgi:hypothetical protein
MACDCVKCLDLRGLTVSQAYLMKKVSKFFPFLLAISSRYAIVSPVASATLNNNQRQYDNETRHKQDNDCRYIRARQGVVRE